MNFRLFSWIWMVLLLLSGDVLQAQTLPASQPLQVSVYDNATLFPGSDQWTVWGLPIHPGITLGTEFYYQKTTSGALFQSARLGYHFQRFIQHSLLLYSELGYRHRWGRFALEGRLGAGYLHAISASPTYRQTSQGNFERTGRWGRPQAMAGLAIGPSYRICGTKEAPIRLFLQYQAYLQFPFVGQYIPILPNTALHLGVSLPGFKNDRS